MEEDPEDGSDDEAFEIPDEVLELPVTDVLDLHSFRPAEVPGLVREWLDYHFDSASPSAAKVEAIGGYEDAAAAEERR